MTQRRTTDRDFDKRLGRAIRTRRLLIGLTQSSICDAAGCSYQQFHKYEVGSNRISASTLLKIARALNVTASQLLAQAQGPTEPMAGDVRSARPFVGLNGFMMQLGAADREVVITVAKALAARAQQPPVERAP